MTQLTILTEPSPLQNFRTRINSFFSRPLISGHYGVTHSLLRGLDLIGASYNYNPPFEWQFAPHVHVLCQPVTLSYAIEFKKRKDFFLSAGPNISVLPSWDKNILAVPEVNLCVVPSDWVKNCYEEDCPKLIGRIECWPAGVDETYWNPHLSETVRTDILIYLKSLDAPFCEVLNLLRRRGLKHTLIQYGSYTAEEYRARLKNARCAIFLSRSESQGIALAESWSMDVPTLVWEPSSFSFNGHEFKETSSCPYLNQKTGVAWKSISELELLFDVFLYEENKFSPRSWVLANMTDRISATNFLHMTKKRMAVI